MNRILIAPMFSCLLFSSLSISARAQNVRRPNQVEALNPLDHSISVSRAGAAYAKPDLGILIMGIASSAPVAEEAVSENAQKAKDVVSALGGLGFAPDRYKLTSVVFKPAGGTYNRFDQAATTSVNASQFVFVFFQGPELSDVVKLTSKAAAVIEALRKAGAAPGNLPGEYPDPMGSPLIVYTIRDSDAYEGQAVHQAVKRAREAAQDIAKEMQVQITGLRSVTSSPLGRTFPMRSGLTPIEDLPYRFYSAKNDTVEILANATVIYDFK